MLNNLIFPETNKKIDNNISNSGLILRDKYNKNFELNKNFLDWLVGFTDAEGNFLITLRDNPHFRINTFMKKKN